MKILQALYFPPQQPGGVSSMVPHVQAHFNQLSHWEMDLFYLPKRIRGKGTDELSFRTIDLNQYEGSERIARYVQVIKDYIWWIKMRVNKRYDIIHAHHPVAAIAMKIVFPDTPVYVTIHSSYERELLLNGHIQAGSPEETFLTSLYPELEVMTTCIMTVSQSFKEYLSRFVTEPERIIVIANGFDSNRFKPIDHESAIPQLVTLCRLVPAKGIDVLLQACALLKKKGHAFVLHIIGDGEDRERLEQMSKDLHIYDDTIFYGYALHPEEFMPFCDIFVLPSKAEAFGNVFAEAALCWLALVGTDVGGIREQIEDRINGLLVPVDDVEALANALEQLIIDPKLRYQLAKGAYEKAIDRYSLSRVIEQLERVYGASL